MRICVFGAGAVGGHVAARAARGGADVAVIARGSTVEAIRARGIIVKMPDSDFTAPVAAAADARELGPQDYVIVTVKAPSLPEVAKGIAPLLGARTAVVFGMNGIPWWFFHRMPGPMGGRRLPMIDPGDAVWTAVGPERAIGAVVNTACTVVEPGVIRVASATNRLILGEPGGDVSERVTRLADVLRAGGLAIEVTPRIRDEVWTKLVGNLCGMPLAVLAQTAAKDVYRDPACADAIRRVIAEVTAIGAALGCDARIDVERLIEMGRRLDHKPSMVQDLELGRTMEIDSMFTVPLELARELGAPTPTLDLTAALVKLRARSAGLYG